MDRASPEIRKRSPRVSRACEHCRSRKVRCDGETPCSGCRASSINCVYRTASRRRRRTNRTLPSHHQSSSNPTETVINNTLSIPAVPQVGHSGHDLVQYKRLRELRAGIGVSNSDTGSFQFYGPSSHFCFIQRIYQRINRKTNEPLLTPQSNAVPDGVEKWGLERFMFSVGVNDKESQCPSDAFISRELGDAFVHAYFDVIHPQVPVLLYSDIARSWENFWKPSKQRPSDNRGELLFMVLALGARVSSSQGRQDALLSEGWADHFARKASGCINLFEDPSLHALHFFLLKAVYAYQVMRPNDAYLYLGHAARTAIALGINRAQVVEGSSTEMHRLRLTFWTIYAQERSCSLYTGRPSAFRDELIDAPYPEDLPSAISTNDPETSKYMQSAVQCGMIRAEATLGKVSDRILVDIYSSKNLIHVSDLPRVNGTVQDCDMELESITRTLKPYLHFFDDSLPIGEGWQEVQRTMLGNNYYIVRMLMHRPALVFATFFSSRGEAQERAAATMDLAQSIDASISSAKCIINLNYDAFFHRYPGVKFDGTLATFLVSACVTLLYDVLDPETDIEYSKNIIAVVERGIKCLDLIEHIGPTTGKALSLDVMRVAKDALRSAQTVSQLDQNVMNFFPWLQQSSEPVNQAGISIPQSNFSASYPSNSAPVAATGPEVPYLDPSILATEVNYIPHWLETGFQPQDIPNSLHG